MRGIREFELGHAIDRNKFGRLAVAEGDGSGFVEKQRIHVSRRFHGAAGFGQHVEANEAVHACDSDRRQQRADRCRNEGNEQRHQHDDRDRTAGIFRETRDRRRGEDEDDGQPDQQDIQRDLVRRLLALCALDQGDHPIQESRALGRGDADLDLVRQHPGAPRHCGAVSATLPNDGGRIRR